MDNSEESNKGSAVRKRLFWLFGIAAIVALILIPGGAKLDEIHR